MEIVRLNVISIYILYGERLSRELILDLNFI